ncbi:restriction endonuclease subunit S [Piscibacillus sp. B03]|uniref:restriction endonuclease subunit S n=1 Tax=Piscibacillus sp. B03 TaxID=3457430 RepID=UPI003FCC3271
MKSNELINTRIGILPKEWEIQKLEDVAVVTMGQSPKSENYNSENKGLPLIQGNADIEKRKTKPKVWTTQITKKCDIGNIIMTVRAPVGKIAKSMHQACIGRGVCSIAPKQSNEYIYYVLLTYEDKWKRYSQGSTFESINSSDIKTLDIPMPKPEEQQKIADILSAWDKAIELKEKLIEQKKEQKKGLMQRLLTGEVRLPGVDGEWKRVPFEEVFNKVSVKKYQIKTKDYLENGEYPVVDQGKTKIVAYSNQSDKIYKIPKDGVIIFGDHTREIKYIDFDFIVGADGTQVFEVKEKFDTKFYYYHLLIQKIPNTGYNRHFKFVKEMWFKLPSIEEQKAISNILYTLDVEIEKNQEYVQKLKQQKKGLMQLLLTGKVRVKV